MKNKHPQRLLISGYAMLLIMIVFVGICDYITPSNTVIFSDESVAAAVSVPFVELEENKTSGSATASIFGVIPLKEVSVSTVDRVSLSPGGIPFGVKFYTRGVIVVGITEVETADGVRNPASAAGIHVSDVITKLGGKAVNTVKEITEMIAETGGKPIEVEVTRGGDTLTLMLSPVNSTSDGAWRAGLWIRDSTAGIGTITFYNPANGTFAGLGHSICDVDTGTLMPMLRGDIYDVTINDIAIGKSGYPGELKGSFGSQRIGALTANTSAGICGVYNGRAAFSAPIPIALKNEVKEGKAEIQCTLTDGQTRRYEAEIVKLNRSASELKNFIIRVTDERLLSQTGGIVQGMSGSPVIQDGRLVGAVTHVLVNDPTRGYGIFIENMLTNMPLTTSPGA